MKFDKHITKIKSDVFLRHSVYLYLPVVSSEILDFKKMTTELNPSVIKSAKSAERANSAAVDLSRFDSTPTASFR